MNLNKVLGFLSAFLSLSLFCNFHPALAQSDLTNLSLEDLMNIEVYSAAKKPERIFDTASAIYVITPEDIRRSGATSIPELLRMVPSVRVEKVDSNTWDISARGFNGSIFANKLLVLIDGRAVYSPLYGGVFWDVQDVVLEDIERIEVIRGPGGTLWGANAVNGVINIITKKAKDTQGGLISAGAGSEERGFSTMRYGGKSGDWFYRSYAKYFNRDEGFRSDGANVDNWDMSRGGFRAEKDKWTIQGDFYDGQIGQRTTEMFFTSPYTRTLNESSDVLGWNLLTRYEDSDWSLQSYWDVTDRRATIFGERRNKIDLEFNKRTDITESQEVSWGLGYRLELEKISNTDSFSIAKPSQTVGSSRVDLQACKLEYSIVSPK